MYAQIIMLELKDYCDNNLYTKKLYKMWNKVKGSSPLGSCYQ